MGVLLLQCSVFAQFSSECPEFSDPNDYHIDDPNTLDNGLFECDDPNFTTYNFNPPRNWERIPHPGSQNQEDCYASLEPNFVLDAVWEIMNPFEGDTFVLLSTGGFGSINGNAIKGSKISQEVFLHAGDTILGAYFFGTTDYRPFNDYASIYLQPVENNDPNERLVLAYCDVETVGSYLSTLGSDRTLFGGWEPFSHTIDPSQVGPYYLQCEVVDANDLKVTSYLGIDGLRICSGEKPVSDLNYDCDVNLIDYSIVSDAWLSFCPDDPNGIDPNDIADPNIPCQLADIDNSWYVDPNDLIIMFDPNEWLVDLPSE